MHNFLKSSVAAATATVLLATGVAVSGVSINANAATNQRMEIASVAYLNQGHLDEWFPKIHSAEAADANSNGYVEKDADSDTILKAYARMISGTYSGNIGKTFSITI